MISRHALVSRIEKALARSRIVALVGPRQSGNTTLARQLVPNDSPTYFDLEDPVSLTRLEAPLAALSELRGPVVLDEIQRRPDLLPLLRVLADRQPLPARFLVLGSASPNLIRAASESLAGRVEFVEIAGFSLNEVGDLAEPRHWLRGGLPPSFLAADDADSAAWRKNFVQTLLERDVPQLGSRIPSVALGRFWTMTAHFHGQIWNAAELARSLGTGEATARRYLDLLEGLFLVRALQPWHANIKKRQVKAPKVYVRDSGLLHHLLGIRTAFDLQSHARVGASWEGYVVEEVLRAWEPDEYGFWATYNGAELDLFMIKNGHRLGVECKRGDAPRVTTSMRTALTDLELERLYVVYPGSRRYDIAHRIEAIPLGTLIHERPWVEGEVSPATPGGP
jgi:predicted AAA+ superfamily ATPase